MLRTPHAIDCNIHSRQGLGECSCRAQYTRVPLDTVKDRVARRLRIVEFHKQEGSNGHGVCVDGSAIVNNSNLTGHFASLERTLRQIGLRLSRL